MELGKETTVKFSLSRTNIVASVSMSWCDMQNIHGICLVALGIKYQVMSRARGIDRGFIYAWKYDQNEVEMSPISA